jgi:hypothetical protein
MKKEKVVNVISIALNLYLLASSIVFFVYLIAPLFRGQLVVSALIIYGSWIGMALVLKYVLKRFQKRSYIRVHEYFIVCLYTIVCMFLWFPYPISIILSVLTVIGAVAGYKTQIAKGKG